MTMKQFPVLCMGFVASFVVAMCLGGFLRAMLQSTRNAGAFFEPEAAGIVALMTVCYVLVHRYALRQTRR